MIYPESISKEDIQSLPLLTFQGTIHVIDSLESANHWIRRLKKESILGFDTEKKPTFQKGAYHPTALVQFSTPDEACLFRINQLPILENLIDLFEDNNIKKVGVSIRDDIQELQKIKDFNPESFIELIDITKTLGIKNAGVRNLSGIFLQKRVSKNQQTSNWENEKLTKAQQLYAAADAWIPLTIYNMLEQKGFIYT